MTAWRPVPGLTPYEVSDDGVVRNRQTGHTLKGEANWAGYRRVNLGGRRMSVHRVVALAFLGPDERDVAHLNGVNDDNRLTNLAYATKPENEAHKALHGTRVQGEESHFARLTEDQVRSIRELRKSGLSLSRLGAMFGVSKQNVGFIVRGVTWKHLLDEVAS